MLAGDHSSCARICIFCVHVWTYAKATLFRYGRLGTILVSINPYHHSHMCTVKKSIDPQSWDGALAWDKYRNGKNNIFACRQVRASVEVLRVIYSVVVSGANRVVLKWGIWGLKSSQALPALSWSPSWKSFNPLNIRSAHKCTSTHMFTSDMKSLGKADVA